jgi:O-antigen ligase
MLGMILGGGVRREGALIYFASLVVVWAALVLSNSRGGLVAMLAQIIVGLVLVTVVVPASKAGGARSRVFRMLRSWPVRIVVLILLLAGVVMGTLWIGGDRLANRFEDVSGDVNGAQTRQGGSRNEIWRATWQMFKAHPIAGVGMGGYWAAIPAYHDASGTLTPQEAHNEYLELLASGGIIGAAIGVWFLLVVLNRIRSNLRSPNRFRRAARYGAVLGLVGVAVHSLFDFGLHMLVNALVFAALIVIATRKGHSEQKRHSSNA